MKTMCLVDPLPGKYGVQHPEIIVRSLMYNQPQKEKYCCVWEIHTHLSSVWEIHTHLSSLAFRWKPSLDRFVDLNNLSKK